MAPPPIVDAGVPDAHEAQLASVAPSPISLPGPRDHHTTAVIQVAGKPYLYVVGGTNAWMTIYDQILRAPIAQDGSLGAFESIGKLREPRAGHAMIVIDDHVIVSGGNSTAGMLDSTIVAALEPDGTLGEWSTGPKLPFPVMHHSCNADGANIYCVGGRIAGNYTGTLVVRTAWNGALDPYAPMPPLAKSIGFHQAFVRDHVLFIAGGLHRDAGMADFDRLTSISKIALDGNDVWQDAGALPEPRYAGSAEVVGSCVYFAGGQNGNDEPVDSIWSMGPDGAITTIAAKLSVPRMHVHQTPAFGGFLYSVGGRDADNRSLARIDIGTFE
jgi:hypothetical protein